MKIKIYLIDPIVSEINNEIMVSTPNQGSYGSGAPSGIWEPYTMECIGSFLKENLPILDIHILQENIYDHDRIVSKLKFDHDLNVVCVSTYSYAANDVISIFEKIKDIDNEIITVSGGYHPSGDENFCQNSCIDHCILGEGEIQMLNLIKSLTGSEFKNDENFKLNMGENSPWPIRNEKFLKRAKSFPLSVPSPDKQINPAMISYGRGCLFNCSFCASSLIWSDTHTSFRNVSDVINEINYLKKKFGTNSLFWTDLALNNDKNKLYELLYDLSKLNNIYSFGYVNQNLDDETAFKLQNAGFRRLGFGVEALENYRLKKIKKFQKLSRIKKSLSAADRNGIITRGYIMMGFPDQVPEDTYNILENIIDLPIDQLRLGFYTPFVGTSSYEEHCDNLTEDNNRFTADLPVFKNHILEEEKWISIRKDVIKRFYNSENYKNRIEEKIKEFPYLEESFNYFFKLLNLEEVL